MRVDPRSVRRAAARGDLVASRACGLCILADDAAARAVYDVGPLLRRQALRVRSRRLRRLP